MSKRSHLLRWGDIPLITIAVLAILFLFHYTYSGVGGTPYVHVSADGSEWRYPLDIDNTFTIDGISGKTVIHIHEGSVQILSSACPTESCVALGDISSIGQWLACLPNGVMVTIEGEPDNTMEVDDVSN